MYISSELVWYGRWLSTNFIYRPFALLLLPTKPGLSILLWQFHSLTSSKPLLYLRLFDTMFRYS